MKSWEDLKDEVVSEYNYWMSDYARDSLAREIFIMRIRQGQQRATAAQQAFLDAKEFIRRQEMQK